jgi:hypothetical protein
MPDSINNPSLPRILKFGEMKYFRVRIGAISVWKELGIHE